MKSTIFGREGHCLYVNSADSIGRNDDYLDEIPGIDAKGRMDIRVLHQLIDQNENVCIDDLVIGKVAIRKYIEECGTKVRNNQRPYGKRQANKMKNKVDFIQRLSFNPRYSLPWTLTNSVDHFVELNAKAASNAHRLARKKSEIA